jgi:2-oxoglutarate dehydrogenase E1 component
MDKYSFLNTAHTSFFSDMYDKYLTHPDSVEPSWRAFFQGFDFGMESAADELVMGADDRVVSMINGNQIEMPESLQKEFQVIRLIDGYRSRGHLFTKTNPVRERRKYIPTLEIENFGLEPSDMDTVFNAGDIIGIGPSPLREIIRHLTSIYCDAIGVEYMYIRKPERIKWIQNWINGNDNHPNFNADRKKHILKKLNQAISFEGFFAYQVCRSKTVFT